MFNIAGWEIVVDDTFEPSVFLFKNSNKIVAVQNSEVIAVIWEVPAGLPRIESNNIAIVISENDHIITLRPQNTLKEIFDYEEKIFNNT